MCALIPLFSYSKLRGDALLEQRQSALEISIGVGKLRFGLLNAGVGLFDLNLQRARINFRRYARG